MPDDDPIRELGRWIDAAREAGTRHPAAVAFVTVGDGGRPSARTVTLKRLEEDALLFTSALWTRKAREIEANPQVALLFHWPSLGRQVHVTGEAAFAERALAEELFSQRDLLHQLQTVVSRQGEPIDDLDPLRSRLAHLAEVPETAPACPEDWGALWIRPRTAEFWGRGLTACTSAGCSSGATAAAGGSACCPPNPVPALPPCRTWRR